MNNRGNVKIFTIDMEILAKLKRCYLEDITKEDKKFLSSFIENSGPNGALCNLVDHFVLHNPAFVDLTSTREYFIPLFNFYPPIASGCNADGKTFLEYLVTSELPGPAKFAILLEAVKAGARLSENMQAEQFREAFKKLFTDEVGNQDYGAPEEKIAKTIFAILVSDMHISVSQTKHLDAVSSNFGTLKLNERLLGTKEFYIKAKESVNYDEIMVLSALVYGTLKQGFNFREFITKEASDGTSRDILYYVTSYIMDTTFCKKENLEIMLKTLLKVGGDLEEKGDYNYTTLTAAIHNNNSLSSTSKIFTKRTLIEVLVKFGADLTSVNGDNFATPLHYAVLKNDMYVINLLIDTHNLNINAVDRYGNTPLHYAAEEGNIDAVKALITAGAHPIIKNSVNQKPIDMVAASDELLEILRNAEVAKTVEIMVEARKKLEAIKEESTDEDISTMPQNYVPNAQRVVEFGRVVPIINEHNGLTTQAVIFNLDNNTHSGVLRPIAVRPNRINNAPPLEEMHRYNGVSAVRARDTRAMHVSAFRPYSAQQHNAAARTRGSINNVGYNAANIVTNTFCNPLMPMPQYSTVFGWGNNAVQNVNAPAANTSQFSGSINAQTRMLPSLQQQNQGVAGISAYNYTRAEVQHFVPKEHSFGYTPYFVAALQQYFGQPITTVNNTFNFNDGINNVGSNVYNNGFVPQPQQQTFNNGNYGSNYRDNVQREGKNPNNQDSGSDSGFGI